jgi:hypothetical protein
MSSADSGPSIGIRSTGIVVNKADLTPVLGMSITLLATNPPDEIDGV